MGSPVLSTDVPRAAELLRAGGLVAFPTETVYGLGAHAADPRAVARVFATKGRPADHPLIVHIPHGAPLERWARTVPEVARRLAARFWPGPLTLILQRQPSVPDAVTGGADTVGLRVPDHPMALELLRLLDGGIAGPSANRFGRVSPTEAAHVAADLGDAVDLILDGGPCRVGIESTIVDCSGDAPVILRPGGIPRELLEEAWAAPIPVRTGGAVRAPGQHPLHYAPHARVALVDSEEALRVRAAELLAEGRRVAAMTAEPDVLPHGVEAIPIPAALDAFAHDLYARLRAADALGVEVVLVVRPAPTGLGEAIGDRLRRAAGPRPADDDQPGT
jgi:L-threonylcarbamoyladenylate synthase